MSLHKSGPGLGCFILLFVIDIVNFPQAGSAYSTACSHTRGLRQDFGQFSALPDLQPQTYGGWGGSWELTPAAPSLKSRPQGSPQNGDTRTTRVRSISNRPGRGDQSTRGSNSGTSRVPEAGTPLRPAPSVPAPTLVSAPASTPGNTLVVNAEPPADTNGTPGFVNGRNNRHTDTDIRLLPRYNPATGTFRGHDDVGFWPSLNPASRINAAFVDTNATRTASATAAAAAAGAAGCACGTPAAAGTGVDAGADGGTAAGADAHPRPAGVVVGSNTTLLDPEPITTVRVPAAAFESGYCVPRQAFLVVNVTARACYPGSNLTTWDGEPVCARLDCNWRAKGTNVLNAANGCRTVVQRPQSICPAGCNLIEQLRFNTTVNRTQLFTRCSCKAGNQPCPTYWTACTCYEDLLQRNITRGYTVCSETQGECERKCNLAISGNPRLAPLCPIMMDPFLSTNATSAPVYPLFGWNIASQGRNTAALSVAGRRLLHLLRSRRRLTMTIDGLQLLSDRPAHPHDALGFNKPWDSSEGGVGSSLQSCLQHDQHRIWSRWAVCCLQWLYRLANGYTGLLAG